VTGTTATIGEQVGGRVRAALRWSPAWQSYGWVAVLAAWVALWWLLTATDILSPTLFPSPPEVVSAAVDLAAAGDLWPHVWATIKELLVATALFVAVGGVLGLVLGSSRRLFDITYGPISTLFAMPKITVLPIFVLAFGLGMQQKVLFGALYGFFPLVMNTMLGARGVRPIHSQLFQSIGARPVFRALRLVLPSMLPFFISGLRIGFVYAGIGVLLAEMYVSSTGLGREIVSSAEQSTLTDFWVYVGAASLILVAGATLLRRLEVRFSRWRESAS
jgi:ABC-type nitrate/sulfonate/bicarbonate transport system permease component